MAESDAAFSCTCGQVRGTISPATPSSGTHLTCHCKDCRAAAIYLKQPDPAPGGVDLFQTTPDTIRFSQGKERLAILRLGPKGPLRWYASCCKAPMFNTLSRPGPRFATAIVDRIEDASAIGPVRARAFVQAAGESPKHKNMGLMVWRLMTRMGAARLSGRWKQTPFFDVETGIPSAPVNVLSADERASVTS